MNRSFLRGLLSALLAFGVTSCLTACEDSPDDSMGGFNYLPGPSVMQPNADAAAKIAALTPDKLKKSASSHLARLKSQAEKLGNALSASKTQARQHLDEANRQIEVAGNIVLRLQASDKLANRQDECQILVVSVCAARRELHAAEAQAAKE